MYYEMNEKANKLKRKWNCPENHPINIFNLVLNKLKDLTLVFLVMDKDISGASIKCEDFSIIYINSKHSKGRQAFTIAHELYHLSVDENTLNLCANSHEEIEKRANLFASCFLMSNGALELYEKEHNIKNWSLNDIIDAEQYFQISHKAMLKRLLKSKKLSKKDYEKYKKDIETNASKRGYDLSLYNPFLEKDYFTLGNYITLTELAHEKELISRGKKEELLNEAYLIK